MHAWYMTFVVISTIFFILLFLPPLITGLFVLSRGSRFMSWMLISMLAVLTIGVSGLAYGRDDGRYAASPLKPWFDSLKSGKGACCSDADGSALSDVDWQSKGGHYRVRIKDVWIDVPDEAVLTQPNLAGVTMVWPIFYDNTVVIRCFIPGVLT